MKTVLKISIILIILASLTGCIPGDGRAAEDNPAGLFSGIWHGWIAPFSLVLGIFGNARIYEANNTGWWYDLGFYMAIISGFGGISLSRKKLKRTRQN